MTGKYNYFFFIGPQRTSTTLFYEWFKLDTNVNVSKIVKESSYFSDDSDLDGYHSLFERNDFHCNVPIVECCPTYFYDVRAIYRIYDVIPDAKLVYIYRNTKERLVSHYEHERRKGRYSESFKSYVNSLPEERLIQFDQLSAIKKISGKDNILILSFADITSCNNVKIVNKLHEFGLNVNLESMPLGKVNSATEAPSPLIAKLVSSISNKLRRIGLHGVVNLFKTDLLKSLAFGNSKDIDFKSEAYILDEILEDKFKKDDQNIREYLIL